MSEAPKPVETPVVAPEVAAAAPATAPKVEETPKPAEEPVAPVVEASASTEAPKVEEAEVAAPAKEEVKPVEEGVLGYKGPGLLKGLIFQKKFFFFGTDAVETKALSSYLRGEKDAASANHNAAWAAHTGKGLLFFSKKATDKASPAGLFNLADVADLTEEGTVEFHFVSGGHKHTFQTTTLAERDNWVAVLKTKIEEAKSSVESVKETEEYKTALAALAKPVVAPVAAKKVEEPKNTEEATQTPEIVEPVVPATSAEEGKEEKKDVKEKARKSRSASRKRTSIFGGIGFGAKKEEAAAPATEETAAPAVEATPATEETPAVTEPVVPAATEEPAAATETPVKPTPSKRSSIFGTLKSQFSQNKEKKTETPAPAKEETEAVSENAPVIPQVESSEPLAAAEPIAEPATETPATNGEAKTEIPAIKSDKRKSSLPWLSKKEKPTSEDEAEKPKSPFAKLRATVKGKSSPKAAEKVEKAPETKEEEAAPAAPVVEEPSNTTTQAPTVPAATQVTASA
ncbi:hypothetical protein HYFRA_00001894 [Hymenoscyphus fraxineus]|uniref:Meiotic expression up-regulated protein 6 PH domain-containing protein n=1 Tax=Hymenoscyphus fraxineus TaxID=746836 RepID=A0A9N9PNV3_9HELO|nr:hypothetical protein HYFRA_00001894 [Hymenoscyphus fraxineus]